MRERPARSPSWRCRNALAHSDPAAIEGDDAVVLAEFRSVREDIRARVEQFELGTEARAPDASC